MNELRTKAIQKRCENCLEIFLIPLMRHGSHIQKIVLQYATCPFCNPNIDMCKGCYLPFRVEKHYAKGMCHTCYNLYSRRVVREHHENDHKIYT